MKALAIIVLLLVPAAARAQATNFGALAPDASMLTVTTGAEHGFVVSGGYAHVLAVGSRDVVLGGELSLDWAELDLGDFRVRAGAIAPVVELGRWKLVAGAAALVRGTHDDIARMIDIGMDGAVLAGHYAPHWFAAGEAGADWAFATRIAATDAYRMQVYDGARDGWYHNTGCLIRLGLQAGVSFGGNDITLRGGWLRDVKGVPPTFPIYAMLGYDRRW